MLHTNWPPSSHCAQPEVEVTGFTRVLTRDAPRRPYFERTQRDATVLHWGQRKLLMSEIEFLTQHWLPGRVVVYAGAAPGSHIWILAEMFPETPFVLVDPAPFTVRPSERIEHINAFFTDDLAAQLAARFEGRVLFVSDIRSGDLEQDKEPLYTQKIKADMVAQERWHMLMRPCASLLKFRLPWDDGHTEYLDGTVLLPVWGRHTTTECRLVVTGTERRAYEHRAHEEQMFHFNTLVRPAAHRGCVRGEGLDRCYDCRAEVGILLAYLRWAGAPSTLADVARVSACISRDIPGHRTLASVNLDPKLFADCIRRRRWG